ncbi:hypothetical protein LINPERPRIM_LOCUS17902 [Linum perenne]
MLMEAGGACGMQASDLDIGEENCSMAEQCWEKAGLRRDVEEIKYGVIDRESFADWLLWILEHKEKEVKGTKFSGSTTDWIVRMATNELKECKEARMHGRKRKGKRATTTVHSVMICIHV